MLLFLALLRDPRAEGATRIRPADLGRLLGLDRAPEVKTLRRKLTELAGCRRGAQLQAALARAHAAARPDALGFLHVDGHVRVYAGTRDLPKTHIARMHLAGHATAETWVADADADPVLVVTAPRRPAWPASWCGCCPSCAPWSARTGGPPSSSTAAVSRRPPSRPSAPPGSTCSPTARGRSTGCPTPRSPHTPAPTPTARVHGYRLAETTVELPLSNRAGGSVALRQIHRLADDGTQIPVLTSCTDLPAPELCWRLAGRWRPENYFKYARAHFALDALDSYADTPDDPTRLVPNPAKATATTALESARVGVRDAEARLSAAIDDATIRATPSHLPLHQVRPDARLLDEDRKLITHAIGDGCLQRRVHLGPDGAPVLLPGRRRGPRAAARGVHPLRRPAR